VLGEQEQVNDVVGDPRGRIHEQEVEVGADRPNRRLELLPLPGIEVGQRAHPRSSRDDAHAAGALDRDLVERAFAAQVVPQVIGGRQAEHDVDVSEAEVGVEDPDTVAEPRQRSREVDDDVRLADAALAAGDGDDRAARRA
jgi:hypothetical protein